MSEVRTVFHLFSRVPSRVPSRVVLPSSTIKSTGPQRYLSTLTATTDGSKAELSKASKPPPPPLSVLPTSALLRSLLVAAISSKPWLLSPSLSVLTWLTKSSQRSLWNVDRNPILRSVLKASFYKQFCGGESPVETRQTLRHMKAMGFRGTILTYAKETVFDYKTKQSHGLGVESESKSDPASCEAIEAWRKGCLQTVDVLGDGDQLALKLTGGGPFVTDAFAAGQLPPQPMMDALHEICKRCKERNVRILIDAESQHYQKGIFLAGLELMRAYNRDGYALVYNTYQAYLKSTPATVARHLKLANDEGFTLGLKLVRGAYMSSDDRSLIHDTKQDTDDAYNSISQGAIKREMGEFGKPDGLPFPSLDLFLASHNKESLLAAHKTHQSRIQQGQQTVPLGFAQLQGMSDELSFQLIQLGSADQSAPSIYKCSTWGTLSECLAYLLRRAAENRDAVSRTADEYRALKREVKRRLGLSRAPHRVAP